MANTPHDIKIALAEFDRCQLPEPLRTAQGDAFREAVRDYLSRQFAGEGGVVEIAVTNDLIIIRWKESAEAVTLSEQGVSYLEQGDYSKGIAALRVSLQRSPDDAGVLFNLGMALTDQGAADEAITILEQLTKRWPDHPGGWVALGVAQARAGHANEAIESLRKGVGMAPDDGHAHKNLGAALSQTGRIAEAREHLRAAAVLLPTDPQVWLNLAMNLEQAGELDAAIPAYRRVAALDPSGQLGERAEHGRNRITTAKFRKEGGALRQDAVSHCLDALRRFRGMQESEIKGVVAEIAVLGSLGFQVNSQTEQYTLRTIPGEFSGLQLLCIEYVGFRLIGHSVDIGFDIAAEYEAARRLFEQQT